MDKQRDLIPLEAIESGRQVVAQKSERDDNDKKEERDLAYRQRKAEIGVIEQQNADRKATRRLRFLYAKAVYKYLCWYSGVAGGLVLLSGLKFPELKLVSFQLSDMVLATIVGTTAVAAIGLVGFVVGGLFKISN